jgi:putative cardiolipin synthase
LAAARAEQARLTSPIATGRIFLKQVLGVTLNRDNKKCSSIVWLFPLLYILISIAGCATKVAVPVPFDHHGQRQTILPSLADTTWLGRHAHAITRQRPDNTGFLLLDKGEDALLWRGALADRAQRTLDAQYFIWSDDNIGTLAAERLLRAADRGVRVRVLVDDFPITADPRFITRLNAHPHIHIRIYNPSGIFADSLSGKMRAMLGDFRRLNRRMHNKLFLVDGVIGIVGGRNVADEYYDMHEDYNFRDRDVLVLGRITARLAGSFDEYWNSPWAVPVEALLDVEVTAVDRQAYFDELHEYAIDPAHFPSRFHDLLTATDQRLVGLEDELVWGTAQLIYDIPGKNDDPERLDAFGRSGELLRKAVLQAQQKVLAETPYLVMMPTTFDVVDQLRARGVDVHIMTNSLASTDNIAAFGGYARQRHKMLRLGIRLYELRPDAPLREQLIERHPYIEGKGDLGLHAKTVVIDHEVVFIGSFNMDPRSTHLNTEMGLLIESRELANQVVEAIQRDMHQENSWHLRLNAQGNIVWQGSRDGKPLEFETEPNATFSKSLKLLLFSLLPISSIL